MYLFIYLIKVTEIILLLKDVASMGFCCYIPTPVMILSI